MGSHGSETSDERGIEHRKGAELCFAPSFILCYYIFMTWALKRQIFYIAVLILFVAGFAFLITYSKLSKAPTCTDLRQNGTETGVDCGGSCVRACVAEVDDISVLWARSFRVVPGRYNAVAYIANHNKNSAVKKINYRFRFGDKDNIYIGKREGTTFIPAGGNFAIFEPAIGVGHSVPVYTTFEFTEEPLWLQVPKEKLDQLKLLVSSIELVEGPTPRLSASIRNTSLFVITDLDVVAILYDAEGNAVSSSSTFISSLAPLGSAALNFTWQEPFAAPVVRTEIIPIYDVFAVKLE